MRKIKDLILEHKLFFLVILISLVLHIISFITLGYNYTIDNDDIKYIESGITLFKTGTLTLYGTKTAQIMPGFPSFIALIYMFVRSKTALIVVLKIFNIIFSLISLTYLYKIINLFSNKKISALTCFLFLTLDYIWLDNLILTETPFIMCFIILLYNTFKLAQDKKIINFIGIIIFYLLALFIRPIIVIYPLFLIGYLLLKKYDCKLLIKESLIGLAIILIVLIPWWIRNYKTFDAFIPLTYGTGNPMYWGSYQGYGYPLDEELDYSEVIDDFTPEMKKYLIDDKGGKPYMKEYYNAIHEGMLAKFRMKAWWEESKLEFLFSYLIYKPGMMMITSFYWDTILRIPRFINIIIHALELLVCFICTIFILKDKKYNKELLFLLLMYFYLLYSTSIGLSFSRYAMSMYPLRFIIDGIGLEIIVSRLKKRKRSKRK